MPLFFNKMRDNFNEMVNVLRSVTVTGWGGGGGGWGGGGGGGVGGVGGGVKQGYAFD